MLLKNAEVQVFKLDNDTFEVIGGVNQFTSLIWPDKFNGCASFELNAPATPENKELFKIFCRNNNFDSHCRLFRFDICIL